MVYSSGIWTAKEGKEDEFTRIWEESATRDATRYPGVVFRLLRTVGEPRRFLSIAGPWKSEAELDDVRATPEFQDWIARTKETLDSLDVFTYELVLEVS